MDHYRILRDVQSGNLSPVYVLSGEEPYFIDAITEYFENEFIEESHRDFNRHVLYGRDVNIDQVISLAKGFPMMGDRQLVLIKEAQDLSEWKKSEAMAPLEHYLEQPQPATTLVLALKNKNLDKRLKVSKSLATEGVVFESKQIRDYKMPEWIYNYGESKGYKIDKRACALLAEYLGSDLGKLVNELNKLTIVVPEGDTIEQQHIEKHIGISKDYNIFELQRALVAKDTLKSNRIVNYFAANPKAHPIQMVLPAMCNFFVRLLIYHSLKDKTQKAAASALKVSPFAINDYAQGATTFNARKTEKIISSIRECDRRVKGVEYIEISQNAMLQELVFKILH